MSENLSKFYTSFDPFEKPGDSIPQPNDHHSTFPQEPFASLPDVHTRLQQIESKLSRLQTNFHEAFSKLESGMERCQRTIESFKSVTSQIEGFAEDHQRNMVIKVKFGHEDPTAQQGPSSVRTESLTEQILSSSTEPEFKKVGKGKRLGRVLSRIKQNVRKGLMKLELIKNRATPPLNFFN
uniref:(northern house mosquito) hypothetical protein n=1 Tax=Culex pipiens TaxID=7175 RepID=A0A8D8C205_CULPI